MMRKIVLSLSAAATLLLACTSVQAQPALATQPLTVRNTVAPNVLFALSVEFPTAITPAYGGTYSASNTYLGYFDPYKCYDYNTSYTSGAAAYSAATAAARYFVPQSTNTTRTCSSKWSGNFLNWVSMAGLDEFRFAMTGGTRIIDTATQTVLQRTFQTNQGGNFGEKSITGATLVSGATPLDSSKTWYFNSSGLNVQMKFGDSSGSNSNSVYVQVEVCKATPTPMESNCKQYGTSYKPVGAIQNNADGMRFGVLSYLNSKRTDNAVLRAKLKFTGQYDYTTGVAVANAAQEWDPTNGVYVANPNATDATNSYGGAVSQSGVANYINLFGASGQPYKTYDVVGKLYYEALAYLRKRTPDAGFYNYADSTNNDNFPVISTWDDPVSAYCQKNFIFMIGDTHTWCDKRLPGGTFTTNNKTECGAGQNGNANDDFGSLGNGDTLNVATWTDNISAGLGSSPTENGASFYMAGMAYWAHTQDIRPDITKPAGQKTTVTTYIIDVQESNDKGVETQYWKAAKYGGFDTSTGLTAPGGLSTWATYDPLYNSEAGATDGTANTNNGIRPSNYLPAGNPLAMITAVNNAFTAINNSLGETAAVAQSSGDLRYTGGAYLYQGTFTTNIWTGDLKAYAVTVVTAGVTASATPTWSATTKLDAANPTPANRVVLTWNDGVASYSANTRENATLSRKGVGLETIGNLSTSQQAALNTHPSTNGVDSLGTARINYLRGSRTDESGGNNFRARTSLLGDIVNSTPLFVGPPNDISFEPGYVAYSIAKASRLPVVYVGANDGFLHGFNAKAGDTDLGKEVLAYMPSPLVRKANKLTASPYSHGYYADASPVTADACPNAVCSAVGDWKTVLVSGLNAGGQGIFALDITDPATTFTKPAAGAASSVVMWEFTDNSDVDLGYTFGRPLIAKMKNGKWAAIFGNGYNNTFADGAASTTGYGYLYIVYLSGPTGANRTWTLGTDYFKLKAGPTVGGSGTVSTPNGLGGPVGVDSNLDGALDYVYAGDVYGNIWKFDVSSATDSAWNTAFSGQPLFTAQDASNVAQPITSGLSVTFSQYGGFLITFGTGSYVFTTDNVSTATQSLYGVLDRNDGSTRVSSTFRNSSSTNSLQKQQLVFANVTVAGQSVSVQSNCRVNYPNLGLTTTGDGTATASTDCPGLVNTPPVQLGWYFDLPTSGQRMVADRPLVESGTVDFVTLRPSGNTCTGGSSGYEYILNVNTGGRTANSVFDLQGSGLQNAAQQYTTGGTAYVVSGRELPAGTTINTPGRFILPASNATTGAAGTVGGAGGTSVGCQSGTFVAGWGCVGGTSGGIQRAAQCYDKDNCGGLFLPGQKNRLYWRQLFTQ